jgi:hypothetical protein
MLGVSHVKHTVQFHRSWGLKAVFAARHNADGVTHTSPGHRPGNSDHPISSQALKARLITAPSQAFRGPAREAKWIFSGILESLVGEVTNKPVGLQRPWADGANRTPM